MRLSTLPSIMLLIAALAFMFAYIASGALLLPVVFKTIGFGALIYLVVMVGAHSVEAWRKPSRTPGKDSSANKTLRHTERSA